VEWDAKARRGEERDANGQRRKRGEGMPGGETPKCNCYDVMMLIKQSSDVNKAVLLL
jgi:hypothetical protein